ncbi:MAG TPA: universal stress protein [Gemmatimonadales bacterium]|nr:universal stress protein [Gemmatimonadales bacterium]HSB70058.1 universal stress protein [Candidatus Methylomirabilis sp.]
MAKRQNDRRQSGGYRRILWPTDFSPVAKAAVPHALRLADADAELVILHVWAPPVMVAPPPAPGVSWVRLDKELREAAREQLQRATEDVRARGGKVRVRNLLVQGAPVAQISRVAKRLACDLIVLATHGRTGLRHVLLGSVAENVVRYAPCPVLTVRPGRAPK